MAYSSRYTYMDLVKEQNRISDEYSKKAAALRALPPDKLEQMNGLSRQVRGLQRELPKARAAGNTAEVDRIDNDIKRLNGEWAAIKKAHMDSIQPQLSQLVEEQMKALQGQSTQLSIQIMVNNGSVKTTGKTQTDKETVVVIGGPHQSSNRAALKVDNVVITLHGSPAHADLFLKNWDTAALAALTRGGAAGAKVSAGL